MSADLFLEGCEGCAAWAADRTSGVYVAACDHCSARALARSPAAWRALRGETDVDIREAILRVFGDDRFEHGRLLVREWVRRLRAAAEKPPQASPGAAA